MRTLLFDLDDTLLDYSACQDACWAASCTAVAQPAGVDPAALTAAIEEVRRWFWNDPGRHRAERTDMVGAWAKIAELGLGQVGGPGDGLPRRIAEDFAERRRAAERLFPDALGTLDALRGRGVPLGLITNGDARLQRGKIARHGLAPYFGVVVIEGEFGAGKPDAAVFHHALTGLGADPVGTWMVGDHLVWDVDGAQRVGLRAAWIDRRRAGLPAGQPVQPERIIHALDELLDLAR
ncbi:MAG TPA: HAD family hydrolase [Methylomirabilota bacterium]|jgi:putative hydrolase of the HAD superfamily